MIFFQKGTKNLISLRIFKISCLVLGISFFATQSEGADTLEHILAKVQVNFNKVETLKMDITIAMTGSTPQINSTEMVRHVMKRTENPKAKITYSNGYTLFINVDTAAVSGLDEGRIWPEPQVLFEIKEYLENSDVNITNQENIYILTSKLKNSPEEFPKTEGYINQNTGMVKKVLIYDAMGNLCQAIEVNEYQLVNNVIWFPKKITDTMTTLLNKIQKEIIYENVEINIEIPDEEFINTQGVINE